MPHALEYGCSYELFWHLNPTKLEPFRIAFNNGLKTKNYLAHLQGQYFRDAIASCFSKSAKYPKEPYGTQREENTKPLTDAEKFAIFAAQLNKQRREKED